VASLIARELGVAARADTGGGQLRGVLGVLVTANTLNTAVIDSFIWTLLTWLLVRWVRTRQDRLLLVATVYRGICAGKDLVAVFWIVLIGAVLALAERDAAPAVLWVSGAVTVVTSLPNLWWQLTTARRS